MTTDPDIDPYDEDDEGDYEPTQADFRPVRAVWSGHLFENPHIGLEPSLWLGVNVECEEMNADKVSSDDAVSVTVDWIPVNGKNFRALIGETFKSEIFAESGEASIYFDGIHHRFDKITLEVLEQRGWTTDFRMRIEGDVDNLGLEALELTVTAEFRGIVYSLQTPGRLAEFTSTPGLVPDEAGTWFLPAENKGQQVTEQGRDSGDEGDDVEDAHIYVEGARRGPLTPDLQLVLDKAPRADAEDILRKAVEQHARRHRFQVQNNEEGRTLLDVLFWLLTHTRPVEDVGDFAGNREENLTPYFGSMIIDSFHVHDEAYGFGYARYIFDAWWDDRLKRGVLVDTGDGYRLTEEYVDEMVDRVL